MSLSRYTYKYCVYEAYIDHLGKPLANILGVFEYPDEQISLQLAIQLVTKRLEGDGYSRDDVNRVRDGLRQYQYAELTPDHTFGFNAVSYYLM